MASASRDNVFRYMTKHFNRSDVLSYSTYVASASLCEWPAFLVLMDYLLGILSLSHVLSTRIPSILNVVNILALKDMLR